MKRVLVIGKFNNFAQEISYYLSEHCQVQLCPDDLETVSDLINISPADLITALLTGSTIPPKELLSLLCEKCPGVPVIVIGNSEDEEKISNYLQLEWVHFMRRPVNRERLLVYLDKLLTIGQNLGDALQSTMEKTIARNKEIAAGKRQKIVLAVDDSPTQLRTMQDLLSHRYKVSFATSAQQAIMAIAKQEPDIILLDYDMPVCDGKLLFQMLRSERATKDIPIVFLINSNPVHLKTVMELRPNGYLLKPCSESLLYHTIDDIVGEE